MKLMFRSPLFWISATIISASLVWFAIRYFPKAFPIVHINLTMNKAQALQQAKQLAKKYQWGPTPYQQAASFFTDTSVKTFVELEAGGKPAFAQMMTQHLYEPYTWQIRHFKEFEKNEITIRFTPDGKPYGFIETISEEVPGPNISTEKAQSIAENNAIQHWHINLADYQLIESSKETVPSGRGDHTFVYERSDKKIGEGSYRLRLTMSGDILTELTHWVKIPETFTRRYQEMRSANTSIAWGAELITLLLYLIGGCIIGLFFLFRKHWVIWKAPVLWGIALSLLLVLMQINQLPLLWMYYNTAQAMNGFLLHQFTGMLYSFCYFVFFTSLILMTAESLTRKAFGHHIQFWHIWSRPISSSYAVLGRTIGGYLLIGFDFAFVVLFYFLTTRYLGWWMPSEELFNPNVLATYLPWLSPLVTSLYAGFREESLFRAIPLAGAALLGKRFGRKNIWIGVAFVLQAIIFGAAHANYPAQPAYARLIELIIPSFAFGGIYLAFGLLPSIISHFIYDVVWFSIPIFISTAPDAVVNKGLIIFFSLTPLWVIIRARLRTGYWTKIIKNNLNIAWKPPLIPKKEKIVLLKPKKITLSKFKRNTIFILGTIGLLFWISTTQFKDDTQPLNVTRTQAIEQAKNYLNQQNIILAKPWQPLTQVFTSPRYAELQYRFIWQEGGKSLYQKLLGTYLMPPYWIVRFAQFEGDIVKRAEEYLFFLKNHNTIFRTLHILPENSPGKQLTEEQARVIAHNQLKDQFNLNPDTLEEISAIAEQQPARKDWVFTFANHEIYPLKKGQARISIVVSGNKVTDAYRYIHVPEKWKRKEQNKQNIINIIKIICSLFFSSVFFTGLIVALNRWQYFTISRKTLIFLFSIFLFFGIAKVINIWPLIIGEFNTSIPFADQLFQIISLFIFRILFFASIMSLLVMATITFKANTILKKTRSIYFIGISIGLFIAGIQSLTRYLLSSTGPLWADFSALGTFSPLYATIINLISSYVVLTSIYLILCVLFDYGITYWQKGYWLFVFLFMLLSFSMHGVEIVDLVHWFVISIVMGITISFFYYFIIRFDRDLIPLTTSTIFILGIIQQIMFNTYPQSIPAHILSALIIILLGIYWTRNISKPRTA